jgi:hypothetical protein
MKQKKLASLFVENFHIYQTADAEFDFSVAGPKL